MGPFVTGLIAALPGILGSAGTSLLDNSLKQAAQNKQNEYNTPAKQMERYTSAGLNPNLIYSQGGPGNQPSVAEVNAPGLDPMPGIMKHMSRVLATQEVRKNEEIIKSQQQARGNMVQEGLLKALQVQQMNAKQPYFSELAKSQAQGAQVLIGKIIQDSLLSESRRITMEQYDRPIKKVIFNQKQREYEVYDKTGIRPNAPWYIQSGLNLGEKGVNWMQQWWQRMKGN